MMEYSADHSAGVSPSTPPVATPAADTPDVGISASSSASDSGAPDYLGVGAVVGGDKLEASSICAQLGTPLDPKSIPVSAPHGTPPPAPGELLQDVQMAEQTTAAEEELKVAADVASESAVPHLVPDGPNSIVVDEPNSYPPAPNSAFPNGIPFPAASDSTEDLPPPAKRARKNSGPTESSRLSPHFTNGHANGDATSSSTIPTPFTLSPAQHRFAVSTLKAMKKLKDAGPFLAPVDYVAFNIPHYPNIIKHPMDISTVERKLTASNPLKPQVGLERYNNVDEFAADVRLIFANCATFNGLEHPVTVMGKRVEAVFDKQMKQMPANEDIKPVVPKPAPPPPPPPKKVAPARRPSTSVPTIRRSDAAEPPQGTSVRPKREIHPPPPKDLPYADAPKKGRLGRGGKRRRDDGTHEQLKFCSRLVNDLYKKQYYNIASPFYDPVDWVKLDLPTYPKIVKKPMDMSTIRKKLDTNEYTDAGQVHKDFLLMFNNCFDFNPRGNPVNTAGMELQTVFLDKWQSLPPLRPVRESEDEEEEESDDEQARTIAMMESQIETMRSSITALKKKPKKDRKSRHGGSSVPGSSKNGYNKSAKNGKKKHHYQRDDDVLTFEQKKALSEAIQTLEGLPLEKVISIIHEGVPEIRDSTEEIELDIDSLPATVLHKLYVEVLKPKPVKSHRGGLGARSISGGVKRKSMDEDAETEKIRLLEDKMKLFTSGGVSYGEGDDSGSASDSSSDSDSASDGSDD